jgi:hypothetical protein
MTNFYQVSPEANSSPITIPTGPAPAHQNVSTSTATGVSSFTFSGGQTSSGNSKQEYVSAADLTPYEAGDWRATARNAFGNPTSKITEDCVVELDGVSGQVGIFVKAGLLVQTKDGEFVRPTQATTRSQFEQDQDTPAEPGSMTAKEVEALNATLEGFDDSTVQRGAALGIASAVDGTGLDNVVASVAQVTGQDAAEVAPQVQAAASAFQAQADKFITGHLGIPAGELPEFYEFCRQGSNKGALQTAIQQQVFGNSMSGYKPLVEAYMSNVAPSASALEANGFETKTGPKGEELVKIQGQWMPTKVAAKVGLI